MNLVAIPVAMVRLVFNELSVEQLKRKDNENNEIFLYGCTVFDDGRLQQLGQSN